MRGGDQQEQPVSNVLQQIPLQTETESIVQQPSLGEKAKKALDAVKNWFGIGQEQTGGKSRKHRKSRKNHRKTHKTRKH